MADVKYIITVDDQGATKKIEVFNQAIENSGRQAGKSTGALSALNGKVAQMAAGFVSGQVVLDLFSKAFRFAQQQIEASIASASEAERVDRKLESALQITGQAAGGAAERFKKYASELQRKTTFDDEAIKSGQALMLQMGIQTDKMEEATRGAIGLASVFSMDLESASRAVAQGMHGNYRAIGMLIPAVRTATTDGEKHAAMMRELEKYYVRAEDETRAYAGVMGQLENAYDELLTSIGDFVVKNPEVINALKGVKSIVEWLAVYIPRNAKLINQLSDLVPGVAGLRSVLIVLAGSGKLAEISLELLNKREKEGEEAAQALWETIVKNADAMNLFGLSLGPVIEKLDALMKKPKPGTLSDMDKLFQDLGIKTVPQLRTELALAERALAAFNAEGWVAPGVLEAIEKKIADLKAQLYGVQEPFAAFTARIFAMRKAADLQAVPMKLFGDFDIEKPLYQLTKLPNAVSDIAKFIGDPKNAPKLTAWKKSFADTAEDIKNTMDQISAYSSQVFSQLDSIFSQSQRNKEIAIENEYKTRLAVINKTIKDETKRSQAIIALEAEYQIKKTEAQRKSAKQQKAVAMMEAVVNTASAVTEALPNLFLAAIIAALGAVQIGTIAAQPIPLAKGGYFDKPTLMPGRDGRTYLGGEADPEIMSPVPVMRQIVREESQAGRSYSITIAPGAVVINAQTIDEDVIDSIAPRLFKAIEGQLRIGRRL